jgi:hypothetical protein
MAEYDTEQAFTIPEQGGQSDAKPSWLVFRTAEANVHLLHQDESSFGFQ